MQDERKSSEASSLKTCGEAREFADACYITMRHATCFPPWLHLAQSFAYFRKWLRKCII